MRLVYWELFRTRVAQRMMGLFLLLALALILVLGVTSYVQVSGQLERQARHRLQLSSRDAGRVVMERLRSTALELDRVVRTFHRGLSSRQQDLILAAVPPSGVVAVAVLRDDGSQQNILGNPLPQIPLTREQRDHLTAGKTVLVVRDSLDQDVFLAQAIDTFNLDRGILWAILDREYLWDEDEYRRRLPGGVEVCVYSGEGVALTCPQLTRTSASGGAEADPMTFGLWGWEVHGEEFLAVAEPLSLTHEYAAPAWTVVLGEPRSQAMAPLADFRRSFLLILLLVTMIVIGISNVQVRRSMEPLRALTDATGRIARQEFDTDVVVTSGDEFEDLASSFNSMAHRLGRQFSTLTAMSDIDRAALSQPDRQEMIRTILARMHGALQCRGIAFLLEGGDGPDAEASWSVLQFKDSQWREESVAVRPEHLAELAIHPEGLEVAPGTTRGYLEPWSPPQSANLILPLIRAESVLGMVVVEYDTTEVMATEHRAARQLADQVAIAMANASLLEDLEGLSSGALTALARTIDANSPWTAGHSERVTYVSLRLGERLGLSTSDLDTLYRGGLLHDIGKIAIPAAILNKPGPLTKKEFAIVKLHPSTGASILSPIGVYQGTIPIVLSHHERLDGSGYPEGLTGDHIPFLARVAAVADVYDALTSARPYRPGWSVERVVEHITDGAGVEYDRDVTDELVAAVRDGVMDLRRNGKPVPPGPRWVGLGSSGIPLTAGLKVLQKRG